MGPTCLDTELLLLLLGLVFWTNPVDCFVEQFRGAVSWCSSVFIWPTTDTRSIVGQTIDLLIRALTTTHFPFWLFFDGTTTQCICTWTQYIGTSPTWKRGVKRFSRTLPQWPTARWIPVSANWSKNWASRTAKLPIWPNNAKQGSVSLRKRAVRFCFTASREMANWMPGVRMQGVLSSEARNGWVSGYSRAAAAPPPTTTTKCAFLAFGGNN